MDMSGVATVVCITVVCYLVGMVMKATDISNKWIPCAVGLAGCWYVHNPGLSGA